MIDVSVPVSLEDLAPRLRRLWDASGEKILAIERTFDFAQGAPVHTQAGRYVPRGWTEWTQGFQVGSALLQYEATRNERFLHLGRTNTMERVLPHVTHFGVHDHGFTIVSTFGNLIRLMAEGLIPADPWEHSCYRVALICSGVIQARRWTCLGSGEGFIYSFNGPHSLFADTIRSLRSLAIAHSLGGHLTGEQDTRYCLLDRMLAHARTTARHIVYYGRGRDGYDLRGRVAHEALFNVESRTFRCASTQQGYSPFTTWTRGLAWIICGYAEILEFMAAQPGTDQATLESLLRPLRAASDYYIDSSSTCGIPYWDTGAPNLHRLGDWASRPADPLNPWEPVDSSAAAIAAQGLLRLGKYLGAAGQPYERAGLAVARTLMSDTYLSTRTDHQGLLLHSVYHWPRRWDYVPDGAAVACGESVMWGDYHLRELALYLQRRLHKARELQFFNVHPQ